jgi:hypothetical protein
MVRDYANRRKKCDLPDDIVFQTKSELASERLNAISAENILPFKYILADSDSQPISVKKLAKNINDYFWYRRIPL